MISLQHALSLSSPATFHRTYAVRDFAFFLSLFALDMQAGEHCQRPAQHLCTKLRYYAVGPGTPI